MKYTAFTILLLLCIISFAKAHESSAPQSPTSKGTVAPTPIEQTSIVVDLAFHLAVFGGLGVAGVIGLRENKRATGDYLAWYRG